MVTVRAGPLCPLTRTSLKMKLSSIAVLFACLGAGLVQAAPAEQLCSSAICKKSAKYIIEGMNATANPCDDFHQFACGGWRLNHKIPATRTRTGTFESLNERMTKQLRDLLANFGFAYDIKSWPTCVSYAAYVYQSCLRAGKQTAKEGLRQVKEVIEAMLGTGWNIGQALKIKHRLWYENFAIAYAHGPMSPIFSISIGPDPKNVTNKMFNIFPGGLGLGYKDLQNLTSNPKTVAAYKEYISKNAKLFCENSCELLEKDIDDIVNFESQLAKVIMSAEDRRNPDKTYNKLTIKELNDKTKFNWLTKLFIPSLGLLGFNVTMTDASTLRIGDLHYVIKAMDIVKRTAPRVIANLIGLKIVAGYGPLASEQFRQIAFEFNKVTSGVQKLAHRQEGCFSLSHSFLSLATSRLFIEHSFSANEKKEAVRLVSSILESYIELVKQNEWLDPVTKNKSVSKLNRVTANVAYPEWLLNNTELDKYYVLDNKKVAHQLMTEKSYLLSIRKFYVNELKNDLLNFNKPVEKGKHWPMPPASINAAYSSTQNSITIPAGIMKFPFFSAERPFALNYGFIGVVIGHEFTHGLDDSGRKYDENGNLHNWWSEEAVRRFSNRSECFVQQYASQVEPSTGLHVNGRNTLGENIADNGGLHEAYNAFQTRQARSGASPRLADLPTFSAEQLFFISYANTWCDLTRTEALKRRIEYGHHSPGLYRVNIPLSNSAQFAKAFNCPAGSKMNPINKCLLW